MAAVFRNGDLREVGKAKPGGQICLCCMLGAESSGLPESVSEAVAQFFRRNIDWVAKVLPVAVGDAMREARAV